MKQFKWHGIDLAGKSCSGVASALTEEELHSTLRHDGIAILAVHEPKKASITFFAARFLTFINGATPHNFKKVLPEFFENLRMLLESGIVLNDALMIIGRYYGESSHAKSIALLRRHLNRGMRFSQALAQENSCSSLLIAMIKSGEASGKLSVAFKEISQYLMEMRQLKKELKSATLMPSITLGFSCLLVIGLVFGMIPRFEQLFRNTERPLPPLTRLVFAISAFLGSWQVVGLMSFLGLCGGLIVLAVRMQSRKIYVHNVLCRLPIFGLLIIQRNAVLFLRALSCTTGAGVSLHESLSIALEVITNAAIKKEYVHLSERVLGGSALSGAFESIPDRFVPDIVIPLMMVGERSGNQTIMFTRAADLINNALQAKLRMLVLFFGPFLLVCIGLLVALILMALYIPLFNIGHIL